MALALALVRGPGWPPHRPPGRVRELPSQQGKIRHCLKTHLL
jgi:hypothetical protein